MTNQLKSIKYFFYILIWNMMSCTQVYNPPPGLANPDLLVVDGFINAGTDSTIVRLSRSVSLTDTAMFVPERLASLSVLGSSNDHHDLIEIGNGEYGATNLNLNPNETFQLKIVTSGGEEYLSDSLPVKIAPGIDSLHWQSDSSGLTIYVNSHDPMNSTRFYKWDYTQTWERRANYTSNLEYENGQFIFRDSTDQVYRCWGTSNSTDILIGSTELLSQDVISEIRVANVPQGSELLNILYSILVRQYALTPEAYTYWLNTKQNTEQAGGLFAPQPGQLLGNVHSVSNPKEPVLGYVSAGILSEIRMFISNNQLPYWYYTPLGGCYLEVVEPVDIVRIFSDTLEFVPVAGLLGGAYSGTPRICGDCRTTGGTNKKPPFWPY
jgi:hypothetical protein